MKLAVIIIFLLALFLESSVTTIPLVFLSLLCLAILIRREWMFALAFIAGILVDAFSFKTLGQSSIYFMIFLFLVFVYERKFEITTKYFIFIASFLGSIGFLLLFSYTNSIILQAVASAVIGTLIFSFLRKLQGVNKFSILNS